MRLDFDEHTLLKLAREMAMNVRGYKTVFSDYGIDENDYVELLKNEFFKKALDTFTREWNATTSTEERLRIGSLAYLEQLFPIITGRAMRDTENLAAATEVGKLLAKMAGVGEVRNDKSAAERFIITINMGGETEHYEKSIEIDANPAKIGGQNGQIDHQATSIAADK
jgi:hypothetical protein